MRTTSGSSDDGIRVRADTSKPVDDGIRVASLDDGIRVKPSAAGAAAAATSRGHVADNSQQPARSKAAEAKPEPNRTAGRPSATGNLPPNITTNDLSAANSAAGFTPMNNLKAKPATVDVSQTSAPSAGAAAAAKAAAGKAAATPDDKNSAVKAKEVMTQVAGLPSADGKASGRDCHLCDSAANMCCVPCSHISMCLQCGQRAKRCVACKARKQKFYHPLYFRVLQFLSHV